ncbi:MAG TPA: hypothetical protein VGF67_02685 [Ktedonobacteraceae bacterium]|jgi:hypothetical protein
MVYVYRLLAYPRFAGISCPLLGSLGGRLWRWRVMPDLVRQPGIVARLEKKR